MTPDEQLQLWVNGNSVHNNVRDECCPDFSCCNQALTAPPHERQLFMDRPDLRAEMCGLFLQRAISSMSVYMAGDENGQH